MAAFLPRTLSRIPIAFFVMALSGCAPLNTCIAYKEVWNIRTEPAGARLYFNNKYVGQSPLTLTATSDGAVWRVPSAFADYKWLPKNEGTWTITAVTEGGMSNTSPPLLNATQVVQVGDDVWKRAFGNMGHPLWSKDLPKEVTGQRDILLLMKPPPSDKDIAKAEYQQALEQYDKALQTASTWKTQQDIHDLNKSLGAHQGSQGNRAAGAVQDALGVWGNNEAQRQLDSATQHLRQAEANFNQQH